MQTRLNLFCEALIEAVILAAVVVAPLFFNVTASEDFSLTKVLLIRSLAWLAALAWLIHRLETRGWPRIPTSLRASELKDRLPPLTLPTILVVLAAALATLVSIDPELSFWGSLERAQGFYVLLAYVIVFLAARRILRTHDQVARLVTAILATSLPSALHALAQALHLDPIEWLTEVVSRPSSSIGNPIFMGEYMVMLLPLTMVALVAAWRAARHQAELRRYLAVGALVVLVGLQLATFIVTQSRGAFLGFLAMVFYLGLLLAARAGDGRLVGGVTIAALAVIALLVFVNLPESPLEPVQEITYVGRLSEAVDPGSATGQQRIGQWEAGVALATSDPVRLLVGYGPDTILYAVEPFISANLHQILPARTDRLHNEFLDIVATGGLVSLAAYLCLFLSAMRLGLVGLGLMDRRPRETWLLVAFVLGSGLLAGGAAWVLTGKRAFLVPVFGLGLAMGLGLYLLARFFLPHVMGTRPIPRPAQSAASLTVEGIEGEGRQLLVVGLLAALVGHLVAVQFSFGQTINRTLFWVILALLTALATRSGDATPTAPPSGRSRRRKRRPTPSVDQPGLMALLESSGGDRLARSLLLGLILGVLLADFLLPWTDFLDPILLGLVGLTWLLGAVLAQVGAGDGLRLDRAGIAWPALSLGWALLVPLLLALLKLSRGFHPIPAYSIFLAWLGLTLAGLAVALTRTGSKRLPLWRSGRWPLYLSLTLVVGLVIFLSNIHVAQADIYLKAAQLLRAEGQLDLSIALHRQALALAPDQDSYYASLSETYLEQAQAASDGNQRAAALEEALQAVRRARDLAPRDAIHFWNLALLYRAIAEGTADLAVHQAWLEHALEPLHQAIVLGPNRAALYVEQARVYLALEWYEEAVEASQQALARDDDSDETHAMLGDAYLGLGQLALAEESYRQALALEPDSLEAHRGLAALHLEWGEAEVSREEALMALQVAPHDHAALRTLALAYQELGSIQEALGAARQARDFAPPSQQTVLETLIAELEEAQTR